MTLETESAAPVNANGTLASQSIAPMHDGEHGEVLKGHTADLHEL
jgi:hypothetical protein